MASYNDVLKLSDVYILQQSNTWPLSGTGLDISTILLSSGVANTTSIANTANGFANIIINPPAGAQFVDHNFSKTYTPTSYTLIVTPGSTTITVTSANLSANANVIFVPGLAKNTNYTFSILSTTNLGNTATSNIVQNISATIPGTPTIGTALANGATGANVTYTAPADNGGATILSYTAKSTPGCITGTVNQSGPGLISISGLTTGVSYTFTVTAINSVGTSASSTVSNSAIPTVPPGSQSFTTAGTYSFIPTTGVTSVSVVAVGGGGGGAGGCSSSTGGGGGLGYKNNYPVTPGTPYTIVVGAGGSPGSVNGKDSYFNSPTVVKGGGGTNNLGGYVPAYLSPACAYKGNPGGSGGSYTGDGGGAGGRGGHTVWCGPAMGTPLFHGGYRGAGGGGAGGYSGTGGVGEGQYSQIPPYGCVSLASAGTGGGGGGGWGQTFTTPANPFPVNNGNSGGGGGVGLFGQGSNGAAATYNGPQHGGGGGSGGANGAIGCPPNCTLGGNGGNYGGGGGRFPSFGGSGAVRVVWPGSTRQFPTTCVSTP